MVERLRRLAPLAVLLTAPAFAVDAEAGKALYATCIACHSATGEGNEALNSPAVAGQSEAYIARQLANFKSGVRGASAGDTFGAQMRPMAAALADDAAIADIAAYIATLPRPEPEPTITGNVEKGRKEYIGKCGACHGEDAEGNEALNSPDLTVISDAYLVRQVRNFQSGSRGAHADDKYGRQMAMMAKLVNDEQLNDIAAFINALDAE